MLPSPAHAKPTPEGYRFLVQYSNASGHKLDLQTLATVTNLSYWSVWKAVDTAKKELGIVSNGSATLHGDAGTIKKSRKRKNLSTPSEGTEEAPMGKVEKVMSRHGGRGMRTMKETVKTEDRDGDLDSRGPDDEAGDSRAALEVKDEHNGDEAY